MAITRLLLGIVLIGYLPGALAFRLPTADRPRRAALAAEERAFWYVLLSVAWSIAVVLVMGAARWYSFDRLLVANAIVCALLALVARGRVGFGGPAARPTWTALIPLALVALGFWRFLPPSEYIIGGKDPGVYLNEGVLLARTGDLVVPDQVVANVPTAALGLFFPQHVDQPVYSNRFMGVFLLDPASGDVVGQFPHAYPASIAIGYDIAGVDGARLAGVAWAVFGLVAVYFLGARLVGRPAAAAASVLLSLQAVQLWFARIPSSEVMMQAVFFGAVLATARAHQDDQGFFAPVAAALAALTIFVRIDALLGIVGIVAAIVLAWLAKRGRIWLGFAIVLAAGLLVAWPYLTGPLRGYLWRPIVYLQHLPTAPLAGAIGAAIAIGAALLFLRRRSADRVGAVLPLAIAAVLVLLAIYAVWLRPLLRPDDSKVAIYDAYALRTFVSFYLGWPAFVAALIGILLVLRKDFWRDPAFVLVFAAFSMFLFYKVQVVPTHFWMARRFVPIILPGALLFAAAAALKDLGGNSSDSFRMNYLRGLLGAIFLVIVGWQYRATAAPLVPHREYDGMVRTVERLASRFTARDLVIVEGRNTGQDTHVLALPLAYVYGRNVLELFSPRPDKAQLAAFLGSALTRYQHVYFVGGGGTDLRSRRISATPLADARVHVNEYQATDWNEYPHEVRRKDFDYTVYELHLDQPSEGPFTLDIGFEDDLYVVRFYAKEQTEGRTIRWTQRQSFIAVPGLTGTEREVQFVLHDGGRPAQAPAAQVDVFFDEVPIGRIDVGKGFTTYTLALPADAVRRAAGRDDPAQLRLVSTVWNPKRILGGTDDRDLGVMIDKVEIH